MPRTVGSGARTWRPHIVVTAVRAAIDPRPCALRFAAREPGHRRRPDLEGLARRLRSQQAHRPTSGLAEIRELIERAEEIAPIDVFFSNAGITGPPGGPPELLDDDWDLLWRVNVMSHIWAARALLPTMLERGEGYLLSTASAAGLLSQLGAIGYATTKHAAVAVAEWLDITYRDPASASPAWPQFVNRDGPEGLASTSGARRPIIEPDSSRTGRRAITMSVPDLPIRFAKFMAPARRRPLLAGMRKLQPARGLERPPHYLRP